MPNLYVIMGPSGCGKSSIALALAGRTDWTMIEADDYHPAENVEKQRNRIPLTDADRAAWLDELVCAINRNAGGSSVLACSALTPYVQNRLRKQVKRTCFWILIDVPQEVLKQRLTARTEHFMPVELLADQLAALSTPADAVRVNGNQAIPAICDQILQAI